MSFIEFSKGLFWVVDASKFDYDKHTGQIIPRDFMRGTIDDLFQIFKYDGEEHIRKVLLKPDV